MKKKLLLIIAIVLLFALALTACSGMPQMPGLSNLSGEEATPEPTLEPLNLADTGVSVEGRLVPKATTLLSFPLGGTVEEVLVAEGDQVKKGDILAHLAGKEQLEAVVAAAEFELFSAKQARKILDDNLELEQNLALQELNQARQNEHDTERRVKYIGGPASQSDIDIAYSQMIFAKNALDDAQDKFEPYSGKPDTNLTRARLQIDLANAQKAYDSAVSKYNTMIGSTNDFDANQTRTEYEIAQGQLKLAQEKYDKLLEGADQDAVASAEARILAAEANLDAAQADLSKLYLVATIDGKVVTSELKVGQSVSPGIVVIELVDFSEWDIETENLTEIEVVDVSVGQKVTVVPDALPELSLAGEVISISDTFEEKRGEITYKVLIKLLDNDPRLRWGMTVVVNFE
jgi:multidrug resistance efflux pump